MPERASLEEVLDFANEVRRAGGGNPIDALMPAVPQDATQCLIAKNLNFNCHVTGTNADDNSWAMVISDEAIRDRIAEALDLPIVEAESEFEEVDEDGHIQVTNVIQGVRLPDRIGQVAADFDEAERIVYRLRGGSHRVTEDEKRLVEEMWPYIEESIRECWEIGTIIDGKLVL